MAVLKDPVGAVFCVWQAKKHGGIAVAGEPGSLTWTQLNPRRATKAKQFYGLLLPVDDEGRSHAAGGSYTTISLAGRPDCGIMPMPTDVRQGAPSHWLNYFASTDVDATAPGRRAWVAGRSCRRPTFLA
jgi:predicted enzyme related to lactoylglutathione lyase